MMERKEFENAINELSRIQKDENYKEDDFQKWLENNKIVFTSYGYKTVIPKPKLKNKDGEIFEPDFLVQKDDGTWEIFEIKRPDTNILKNKKRRVEFYSALRDYVSQCHDYIEYFDDSINRDYVNEKFGVKIPKSLKAILVAGINEGFDRIKAQQILYREGAKIELQTYDDIRIRLELFRSELYSKYEDLRGLSCHIVLKPHKLNDSINFLLDLGKYEKRNRISLYIDKTDTLTFRIFDRDGNQYKNHIKVNTYGFNYNKWCFITFEFGIGEDYSIMILEVNGKYFKDVILSDLDINFLDILGQDSEYFNYTIGSDYSCKAATRMRINNILVYSRTLTFPEKTDIRNKYNIQTQRADISTHYLIEGNQYIRSSKFK